MPERRPDEVAVLGWARTPFGKFGGVLRGVRLPALGAVAVRAAVERSGLPAESVDEVAMGVNFPGSERSVARQVALRAGIPEERTAYTVDRACCSSLTALALTARGLRLGETSVAVAGGVDNLSRVPYFVEDLRFGNRLGDVTLTDSLVISCPHTGVARAVQASDEAARYGVDRAEQDEWAWRSQQRYEQARALDHFADEVVPVDVADADGGRALLDHDEVPRPQTTLEALGALPTVNGSATVTAGNAPNLSSGASALVLAGGDRAATERDALRATLHSWAKASGEPANIASIPAVAAGMALTQGGLSIDSIDLIEINEAFAAVPLVSALVLAGRDRQTARRLLDRVNVNGGAIAVGHPTGATAGRLVMTAICELQRRGGGNAVVAICGGVGEGEAVLVTVR